MSLHVPVPDHILQIHPYIPGKPVEEVERELGLTDVVKMASNENPLGPSPKALAALHDYCASLHYYPEGSGFYLRQALSEFYSLPMDHIILGSGSVDLIELICRAFMDA
ncbi:MAG: hypothetical protein P8018_10820 [Acidobacteriota bacterium]